MRCREGIVFVVFWCLAAGAAAQTAEPPAGGGTSRVGTNAVYSASDVASGTFGLNTGGGNYVFPGTLAVNTASPAGYAFQTRMGTNANAAFSSPASNVGALVFHNDANSNFAEGRVHGSPLAFYTSGLDRLRIDTLGNVGIGTPGPRARFHVHDPGTANEQAVFSNTGSAHTGLAFSSTANHLSDTAAWGLYGGPSTAVTGRTGRVALVLPSGIPDFSIVTGGASLTTQGTPRLTVTQAGNVGIGEPNPTARLVVAGDLVATGSITGASVINAVFQDLAEWVPADADLLPGTVVVLNPARDNEVMASHRPYDSSVAGVVSEQPGILLGVAGDSKEQIATTGRVRVRVDATAAPIRIGDLLVTSGKPGLAMRSEPMQVGAAAIHRPGTIIGKALQALQAGEGEILVLLSLQ